MGTVRVEHCPDCGVMVGEGRLYEHQLGCLAHKRNHPKPTPMPPLEVGDWVRCDDCGAIAEMIHPETVRGFSQDPFTKILEIRKADGRVWRREP